MSTPVVLIVDPTAAGDSLAVHCSDQGLTVVRARTASAALDLIIEESPDVAIVEINLPDATGFDLAQILCGEARIPFFLASEPGRTDEETAMLATLDGVAGHFIKPYQSERIIEHLATALGADLKDLAKESAARIEQAGSRWGSEDVVDGDPLLLVDEVEDDATNADVLRPAEHGAGQEEEVHMLVEEVQTSQSTDPFAAVATTEEVTIPNVDLAKVWVQKTAAFRPEPEAESPEPYPRSGELSQDGVGKIFDAFYRSKRSGELALSRGSAKRLIVFSKGHPVFARSNVARERFGNRLLRQGFINAQQLRQAVSEAGNSEQRLGQVLVQSGVLRDQDRRLVLAQVVRSIVLSSFFWSEGQFQIGMVERARTEPIQVPMHTGNVILRGTALTASPEQLSLVIPDDARLAPVADPPYPLSQLRLTDIEAHIVVAADGTKMVSDLLTLFDIERRALLGLLYGLSKLELVELVGYGPSKPKKITFF